MAEFQAGAVSGADGITYAVIPLVFSSETTEGPTEFTAFTYT